MGSEPKLRRARSSWPVRARLLIGLIVVTALGMAAGGSITFLIQRERVLSSVDAMLEHRVAQARFVVLGASNSKPADGTAGAVPLPFTTADAAVQAVISRILPDAGQDSLGIVDGRAKYVPGVATSFRVDSIPGFVADVVAATRNGSTTIGTVASGGRSIRYIAAPVVVQGSADTGVYVAAVDLSAELAGLSSAFETFWEVMGITLVAIAAAGWFVAGRLLRPLRTLRIAAANITTSSRGDRIPVEGHDDLAKLTVTVNEMLDRLDDGMTRQRQLLDDVRHELNTPIAIVMGHIETVNPHDPADVEEMKALAVDELERIGSLVKDLAALAETEHAEPELAPVDVADLTRQVFAKASVLPGHRWELGTAASATARLDAQRITQAWLQLVDNASKYSPPGSPIRLGSSRVGGSVEFWVEDEGPGVPPEARDRIFDRFGRVESNRGVAGSGLGLAIVKAIAIAHAGTVSLVSSDSGSRFAIVVPVTSSPPSSDRDEIDR